jgi:hypothetical protein
VKLGPALEINKLVFIVGSQEYRGLQFKVSWQTGSRRLSCRDVIMIRCEQLPVWTNRRYRFQRCGARVEAVWYRQVREQRCKVQLWSTCRHMHMWMVRTGADRSISNYDLKGGKACATFKDAREVVSSRTPHVRWRSWLSAGINSLGQAADEDA